MRALLGCLVLPLLGACAAESNADETEVGAAASALRSDAVVDGRLDMQAMGARDRVSQVARINVPNPPPPPWPIGRADEIDQVARINIPNPPPPPPPIGHE